MWFKTQTIHYPQPDDPQLFIDKHVIDIVCGTEDYAEVVAGRIAIDYLDLMRASLSGEDILQIADADSGGWEGLVAVTLNLEKPEPEIREDFGVQGSVFGFGFLYQAYFHPSLRPWQSFIVDAVCRTFPEEALIFTYNSQTDLSPIERANLGFRKVAQTNYQFRPNMLKTKYDPTDETERLDSIVVPADAEHYVNEHWS